MSAYQPKKGDRVQWRERDGTVADDYWSDRDRYTVRFDDGSESDHGAYALKPLVTHQPEARKGVRHDA